VWGLEVNCKTGGRFNDGELRPAAHLTGSGEDLGRQRISKNRSEPIRREKAQQLPVGIATDGENLDPIAAVGSKDVLESVKRALGERLGGERRERLGHGVKRAEG
jgi:hypothetical protein